MAFLQLTNLRKTFGAAIGVDSINLTVEAGEFVSFLGPSGCGKTTTLRMIAGFERPTAGQILIDGVDVTAQRPNQRNIGMVFQSYALFPNLSVRDNIGFGLKVAGKPKAEIQARVAELLGLIKLEEFGERYPYQLSGGQQQRVALARALAIRPQLLLLDEPLSALDAKIRVSLRNEIRAIQRHLGITTIYVTHDQEEALSLSDRVVVMNRGRIEQVGTPFAIYNFPQTHFVASFVGTLNILPAQVVDPAQGILRVAGQTVRTARALADTAVGEALSLALRPELLVIDEAEAGTEIGTEIGIEGGRQNGSGPINRLTGTVDTIAFLGSIVRMQIRVGDALFALDEFNNPHLRLPELGATVTVRFPGEACLILDDAGRARNVA
jgi:putative spermidine/putrescine transport system ATP-binding protein